MASAGTVEIDFAAETAKFTAELKKVRSQLSDLQGTTKQIASGFEKAGKVITGVFAGLAVGRAISAVVRATAEAEESSAKLANALQSSGAAADLSLDQLKNYASELQRTTTVSDEAAQEVESLLLSFRGLSGDTVLKATSAVLDLSARMGTDLRSAAIQVGKALSDPEKGLTALAKAGVKLPPALIQTVELLTKTGQQAKAQALILQELERSFGGAAAAARNNFGGALEGVKNAFDDLLENKSGAPGATKALNELADTLNSKETQEGFDHLVGALTKIVELTAKVANAGTPIGNAVASVLVPGAGLNAIGLVEQELAAQQQIVKLGESNFLVSKEDLQNEKARVETLKQRIALLKAVNDKPLEPVAITQTRVAQAAPDTSAFDIAKRKQLLDASLEATRAVVQTTLNEFDALNDHADEVQKRIVTAGTQSTLDGLQEVSRQLNAQVDADVQHWIESEDRKREATQRAVEARYQVEVETEAKLRSFREAGFQSASILLTAFHGKYATVGKAILAVQKALAIKQAIMDTSSAVMKTYAAYGATPWGIAAAAGMAVLGAAQVAAIASETGIGGGTGISSVNVVSPPTPAALPVPAATSPGAQPSRQVQITVLGVITKDSARAIADALADVIEDSDVTLISANSRQAQIIRGN